ncbi:putative aldehyde dehydrogenase [Serendipita vermifera]|nr:putative aldehyde dehydrogenase [Serendipita vermifera]
MATSIQIKLPTGKNIQVPTGLFIDNQFVPAIGGGTFETINPSTEEVICKVAEAKSEDIDAAVKSARKAFKTTWGNNISGTERGRLLYKLADLMERDQQTLAELEALDNGKPVRIARDGDIVDSIACLRYYAGWADKLTGQTIASNPPTKFAYTREEPIGVCGQIIPWNYPIMMWAWKVGPALATGCTVVMKPSELTPLTALKLCELICEAGFPAGVLNCVPGLGAVSGAALASHPDVDKVAFTGSTLTGRKIMEAASKSNLKKISLELGGKSPSLIFESADLEQAAAWGLMGGLYNTGQDCTCGSRIYVQSTVYEKFLDIVKRKVQEYRVGDGFDEGSSAGPLISKVQFDKVTSMIASGIEAGATPFIHGKSNSAKGFFVEPVIFTDVKSDMKIVQEEIFGPVICIGRFETEEEAIELANDTKYGLGAAVYSTNGAQCIRVSSAIAAGTVWINQYGLLSNQSPFGGYKMSGIGRELGSYALAEYTVVKSVLWNVGDEPYWPL